MPIFASAMGIIEVLLIAVGLSMDAFAVSIAKGISTHRVGWRHALLAGLWFGGFQALMPCIGYFLGLGFAAFIGQWDHWVAWFLLTLIGANMVKESFSKDEEEVSGGWGFWHMLTLAVATSIDALAVGVSFAFLEMSIWMPIIIIGITTMMFSIAGVLLGKKVGERFKSRAELLGGLVLIAIGCKILIEHTME
jgi:putative Mn2+ efflux pump MntP